MHPGARTPHRTSLTNPGGEGRAATCSVPHYGVCSSHFSAEGDAHAAGVSVGIQPLAGNNHSLPRPLFKKCKPRPFKAEGIALQCHWVVCQYFLRSTRFLFVAHFSSAQVQCSSHAQHLSAVSYISCLKREESWRTQVSPSHPSGPLPCRECSAPSPNPRPELPLST